MFLGVCVSGLFRADASNLMKVSEGTLGLPLTRTVGVVATATVRKRFSRSLSTRSSKTGSLMSLG